MSRPSRLFPLLAGWLILASYAQAQTAATPPRESVHPVDYAVLASYFAGVLLIGLCFRASSSGSVKEYFRGDNNIPAWAAGLSLMATRLSAVTFVSIPAKAYATDWTYLLLPFSNLVVAGVVSRWVVPFYHQLDLTSIYEYLEARFSRGVRLLGSLSFLALETARLSVLVLVPALVIAVVADVNIYLCIFAIGAVTTVSTALGGIKGVIWVDVLQAALMLGGALLCIGAAWFQLDHPLESLRSAAAAGKLKLIEPSLDLTTPSLVIVVLFWFGEIKNYIANQTNAQRFIVTRDVASARRTVWIGAWSMVATIVLCMAVGTTLYLFYTEHPQRLPELGKPDELLPWFIIREVPVGIAGLLLAAIFSAAMSSLNSALNSISSVVVRDLYQLILPARSDRDGVRVGRIVVWIAGALATGLGLLMAGQHIESLFDQLTEMLGLFGGPLGGVFLLGISTTRAHSRGVLLGYVASCLLLAYVKTSTSIHLLSYLAIGTFGCFAFGYLFSRLLPGPVKDLRRLTVHTASLPG
jgi:SSS family transporter